jgi:hypothetical protein
MGEFGALNPEGKYIAPGQRAPRNALKKTKLITSDVVHQQALGERLKVKMW